MFQTSCADETAEICLVLWSPASKGAGDATLGAFVPIEFLRGAAPPINTFVCDVPTASIWAGTTPLALLRHLLAYDAHALKRAVCGPYVQLMRDGMPVEFRASWAAQDACPAPSPSPVATYPALMTFRALYEHQCIARGAALAASAPQLMLLGSFEQGRRGFPSLLSTLFRVMTPADAIAGAKALRSSCAVQAGFVAAADIDAGAGLVADVHACFRTAYELLRGGEHDGQWAVKMWVCDDAADVGKLKPCARNPSVAFVVDGTVLSSSEYDELEATHGEAALDGIKKREYDALIAADPGMVCPIKYAEAMHLTFDTPTQFGMKAAWAVRNPKSGVIGGTALKHELTSVLASGTADDMMRGALLLRAAQVQGITDVFFSDYARWAVDASKP
jgi:hypothetical protein